MSIKDVLRYMTGYDPDGDDYEPAEPRPIERIPAPPPRTVVGGFVVSVAGALDIYRNQLRVLDAEIAAKIEHRRQLATTITGAECALVAVSLDPALTEDERNMADGGALQSVLERELG